jgi:hypothetical protein
MMDNFKIRPKPDRPVTLTDSKCNVRTYPADLAESMVASGLFRRVEPKTVARMTAADLPPAMMPVAMLVPRRPGP